MPDASIGGMSEEIDMHRSPTPFSRRLQFHLFVNVFVFLKPLNMTLWFSKHEYLIITQDKQMFSVQTCFTF